MPWQVKADPLAPEEAINFFRSKVALTDSEFYSLAEDARHMAFSAAGAARLDLVNELYGALSQAIEKGTTLQDFKDQIGAQMTEAWGHPNAPRLENIFRTNVMSAYGAGRWAQMTKPEALEVRPNGRYSALMDSRVCPLCAELNGTVLPLSSPFWLSHNPPMHHQDRCEVENLRGDEAKITAADKVPTAEADPGFGIIPLTRSWSPDLQAKEAAVAHIFSQRLRDYPRPPALPPPPGPPPPALLLPPPPEPKLLLPPAREPPPVTVRELEPSPHLQVEKLNEVEAKYCDLRKERGVIVTDRGTLLMDKLGTGSSVPLTNQEMLDMKGQVFTHNHPGGINRRGGRTRFAGQSLSPADAFVAAKAEAKAMRAVTRHSWDGAVYSHEIRPAPGQPWPSPRALESAATIESHNLKMRLQRELDAGTLTTAERQKTASDWWHQVWLRVVERPEFKGKVVYERRAVAGAPKRPKKFEVLRENPFYEGLEKNLPK